MQAFDLLKIRYLLVLASDDAQDTTVFQGFSKSWRHLHWALHALATCPSDVIEPSQRNVDIISHRLGDARPLVWLPIGIASLEKLLASEIGGFIVCFSGELDVAERVSGWASAQSKNVLHVSSIQGKGHCTPDKFNHDVLRAYLSQAFESVSAEFNEQQRQAFLFHIDNWKLEQFDEIELKEHLHNTLLPNHMSLARARVQLKPGEPFIGHSESEYTTVILDSMKAVDQIRNRIGWQSLHSMTLMHPSVFLFEPALFRNSYRKTSNDGVLSDRVAKKVLRLLQTQRGLHNTTDAQFIKDLEGSSLARSILTERRTELETLTLGVGLRAAQTCSSVMRLSPAVNHVYTSISAYSSSLRSNSPNSRMKSYRLFENIQSDLTKAVGREKISYISGVSGPVKIVSDGLLEWLPIDGLPLCLRHNCSRIAATPGNLAMSQLTSASNIPITIAPLDLRKILLISSFKKGDPLKGLVPSAVRSLKHMWGEKLEIRFVDVETTQQFIDSINAFDGQIMIFDGHGRDNADQPIGTLAIGNELVDVWHLDGINRVPPVVILSSCDTHSMDASTHATVGNGFLARGARTVLATVLPINGQASAIFIGRLLYRIADFPEAALKAYNRVLNWNEIVSGMLRMFLASELLDQLVGPPSGKGSARAEMQNAANWDINSLNRNWHENLLGRIAKFRKEEFAQTTSRARSVLARSESLRYIQLGNPESILIDDGTISAKVLKEYAIAVG